MTINAALALSALKHADPSISTPTHHCCLTGTNGSSGLTPPHSASALTSTHMLERSGAGGGGGVRGVGQGSIHINYTCWARCVNSHALLHLHMRQEGATVHAIFIACVRLPLERGTFLLILDTFSIKGL